MYGSVVGRVCYVWISTYINKLLANSALITDYCTYLRGLKFIYFEQ